MKSDKAVQWTKWRIDDRWAQALAEVLVYDTECVDSTAGPMSAQLERDIGYEDRATITPVHGETGSWLRFRDSYRQTRISSALDFLTTSRLAGTDPIDVHLDNFRLRSCRQYAH